MFIYILYSTSIEKSSTSSNAASSYWSIVMAAGINKFERNDLS